MYTEIPSVSLTAWLNDVISLFSGIMQAILSQQLFRLFAVFAVFLVVLAIFAAMVRDGRKGRL